MRVVCELPRGAKGAAQGGACTLDFASHMCHDDSRPDRPGSCEPHMHVLRAGQASGCGEVPAGAPQPPRSFGGRGRGRGRGRGGGRGRGAGRGRGGRGGRGRGAGRGVVKISSQLPPPMPTRQNSRQLPEGSSGDPALAAGVRPNMSMSATLAPLPQSWKLVFFLVGRFRQSVHAKAGFIVWQYCQVNLSSYSGWR